MQGRYQCLIEKYFWIRKEWNLTCFDSKENGAWPVRSKHFLRIGKVHYVPLLLFTQVPHFTQETFDLVLSLMYDYMPQELTLDPKTGHPLVVSPFHAQRPNHVSNAGLHFCYYWIAPFNDVTVLAPREDSASNAPGDHTMRDNLQPTNMTLLLFVLSCPEPKGGATASNVEASQNNDPLVDMSAIVRPTTVEHFFARESSSSSLQEGSKT